MYKRNNITEEIFLYFINNNNSVNLHVLIQNKLVIVLCKIKLLPK